jgi:hypothetical protein
MISIIISSLSKVFLFISLLSIFSHDSAIHAQKHAAFVPGPGARAPETRPYLRLMAFPGEHERFNAASRGAYAQKWKDAINVQVDV